MTIKIETLADISLLPISIRYVGEVNKADCDGRTARVVDQWEVKFNSPAGTGFHTFEYSTGKGLRSKNIPIKPQVSEVLHALVLEAKAADLNLSDFCAEFGYDDDSIADLNIYKKCLETRTVLLKYIGSENIDNIAELTADI